ncbi:MULTISPECIES: glutaredoxin family protein [Microbacterium]|uniref:Glutaredoxin family protein n=1 Tax=Microbacterium marmarense TaxID=3122051 RepID=A0ABU8LTD0_9MICO
MKTITLIGKSGCHLCDVARDVIEAVADEFPENAVALDELSIEDDPALYAQWWEKIPVVLVNGEFHAHWRVSPDRLRAALASS